MIASRWCTTGRVAFLATLHVPRTNGSLTVFPKAPTLPGPICRFRLLTRTSSMASPYSSPSSAAWTSRSTYTGMPPATLSLRHSRMSPLAVHLLSLSGSSSIIPGHQISPSPGLGPICSKNLRTHVWGHCLTRIGSLGEGQCSGSSLACLKERTIGTTETPILSAVTQRGNGPQGPGPKLRIPGIGTCLMSLSIVVS